MTDVGVLVIHGIGSQGSDFADPLMDELFERLDKDHGKDSDKVRWEPVFWADVLAKKQKDYLKRANKNNDLDWVKLRGFFLNAFGDASAYRKVPPQAGTINVYEEVHTIVAAAVTSLYTALGSQDKPMIVLAHSLGGHIMSNYIWDQQKHPTPGLSDFEQMKLLTGLITFGCNIPLFTFAYDDPEPIKFPPPDLSDTLKQKSRWDNYYDPDDILGYPLKQINAKYKAAVSKDIPINVGGLIGSWNPASHTKYWTDNDFTKPVAKYLAKFIT